MGNPPSPALWDEAGDPRKTFCTLSAHEGAPRKLPLLAWGFSSAVRLGSTLRILLDQSRRKSKSPPNQNRVGRGTLVFIGYSECLPGPPAVSPNAVTSSNTIRDATTMARRAAVIDCPGLIITTSFEIPNRVGFRTSCHCGGCRVHDLATCDRVDCYGLIIHTVPQP